MEISSFYKRFFRFLAGHPENTHFSRFTKKLNIDPFFYFHIRTYKFAGRMPKTASKKLRIWNIGPFFWIFPLEHINLREECRKLRQKIFKFGDFLILEAFFQIFSRRSRKRTFFKIYQKFEHWPFFSDFPIRTYKFPRRMPKIASKNLQI